MKRPLTCVNLIKAIGALSAGQDPVRLSRAMANVIVAQMLPDGVVKGGSSLLFRYGRYGSRYTRDIDTARGMELNSYLEQLNAALTQGWSGFTGKIVSVEPPQPIGVPSAYVMMPYDIKLNYCGRPWQTIRIEIGHMRSAMRTNSRQRCRPISPRSSRNSRSRSPSRSQS